MRLKRVAGLAVISLVLTAGPAFADRGEELGKCLIDHSSGDTEALMKKVLIQALQDQTEDLQTTALQFSLSVIGSGQANCGLKMSELQDPAFQQGVKLYGEFLGKKIFGAAMAKLGGQ